MDMHLITDDQLAQALAEQLGLQVVNLADVAIGPEVLGQVTEPMAQLYRIVPVSFKNDVLTVAMCDPQKLSVLDELRSFLGYEIRFGRGHREGHSQGARALLRRWWRERRVADLRHGERRGAQPRGPGAWSGMARST